MSETIPDRVSIEETSPDYFPHYRRIGVKFNDEVVPNNVVSFCVSENWIRQYLKINGRIRIERGKIVTIKRLGKVEPFWREDPDAGV